MIVEENEPSTPMEEGRLIADLMQQSMPLKEDDEWYVLNMEWWLNWQAYTGYQMDGSSSSLSSSSLPSTSTPPGIINNEKIIEPDFILLRNKNVVKKIHHDTGLEIVLPPEVLSHTIRESFVNGIDFVMVPKAVWDVLVRKYDTVSVAVPRYAYRNPLTKAVEIDVFPVEAYLKSSQLSKISPALRLSRSTKARDLKRIAMTIFGIDYAKYSESTSILINDTFLGNPETRVGSLGLGKERVFINVESPYILEINGDPPPPKKEKTPVISTDTHNFVGYSSSLSYPSSFGLHNAVRRTTPMRKPGLCGLDNLGNTCYMNSALQCLGNTTPLADYMLSGAFEKEVNKVNPTGSRGEVVNAFAGVLQAMWKEGNPDVHSPAAFKRVIGNVNATYADNSQQDARHFIECVLTELHEDVNRVRSKPYIEAPDYNGEPLEEWAQSSRRRTLARDDSFINDTFMGQTLDTTYCPACGNRAVSFENFKVSTVYIPYDGITVTLAFNGLKAARGVAPLQVVVPWEGEGTAESLAKAITRYCNSRLCDFGDLKPFLPVRPERIIIAGVNEYDALSIKGQSDPIANSPTTTLCASIVDGGLPQEYVRVAFVFYDYRGSTFGVPYFVSLPSEATYAEVARELLRTFAVFTRPRALEEWLGCPDASAADLSDPLVAERFAGLMSISGDRLITPGAIVRFEERSILSVRLGESGASILNREWLREVGRESGKLTLEQCLGFRNNSTFVLDDENRWTCGKCKKSVNAIKQNAFWHLPQVMILCLNRFVSTDGSSGSGRKLDDFVEFPVTDLDLSPFVQGPEAAGGKKILYDLYAVSNHYGSLNSGHYTAYAKNRGDGKWYCFNDSLTPKEEPNPVTENAYILFYIRKDPSSSMETE